MAQTAAPADLDVGTAALDEAASVLQQIYGAAKRSLILDCRHEADYHERRLAGAACIPAAELLQQPFLLPNKAVPFAVVLPSASADDGTLDIVSFLTDGGWRVQHVLRAGAALWGAAAELGALEGGAATSGQQAALRRRWLFKPSPLLEQSAALVERELALALGEAGATAAAPAGHSPQQQEASGSARMAPTAAPLPAWEALDLGCGSGRDVVWLACRHLEAAAAEPPRSAHGEPPPPQQQQQQPPAASHPCRWHVTGVDRLLGALQRTADLGARAGLSPGSLDLLLARVQASGELQLLPAPQSRAHGSASSSGGGDAAQAGAAGVPGSQPAAACPALTPIRSLPPKQPAAPQLPPPQPPQAAQPGREQAGGGSPSGPPLLAPGQFHLILCVRFLERALLPALPALLAPGGFVAYSTWVEGPGLAAFGRPSGRARVLEPGELAGSWFGPGQGFRVWRDEVAAAPDGRELTMFLAQRLPEGSPAAAGV